MPEDTICPRFKCQKSRGDAGIRDFDPARHRPVECLLNTLRKLISRYWCFIRKKSGKSHTPAAHLFFSFADLDVQLVTRR
jgi:hypothetical protein